MARLIFMGTPEFAVPSLEGLIASGYEIAAVYTQPDRMRGRGQKLASPPVKRLARAHGLPVYQPTSLKDPEEMKKLAEFSPDIIVVASFGQILPSQILAVPPFGCINVHPSLLPRHRGPSPIIGTILAGDETSGVTIMLMDSGIDTGTILAQREVPVSHNDTAGSLGDKLAGVAAELLAQTLPLWLEGHLTPQPQNEKDATYSKLITKKEGELNWHLPTEELGRKVRAFQPWPGCYSWWRGKRLKILEASPLPGKSSGEPGRVLAPESTENVAVATAEGILELRRVQLEGRRPMRGDEFLRGQRGFVGSLLPVK